MSNYCEGDMSDESAESNPILALDLGDGGPEHRFNHRSEAMDWLQREIESWGWLDGRPQSMGTPGRPMPYDFMKGRIGEIRSQLAGADAAGSSWETAFRDACTAKYVAEKTLIHSQSRIGQFLFELKDEHIDQAAWSFALWTQKHFGIHVHNTTVQGVINLELLLGVFKTLAMLDGYMASHEEVAALTKLESKAKGELAHQIRELVSQKEKWGEHDRKIDSIYTAWGKKERKFERRHSSLFSDHKKSMERIEQEYTKKMALLAPVQYWENRSKELRRTEQTWGAFSLISIALATCLLPQLHHSLTQSDGPFQIPPLPTDSATAIVTILTRTTLPNIVRFALVAGMVLWWIRICVRNYLSASHLATDANERAMLIQTYLSIIREPELREDGKLREQMLPFALQSIFRHSADGLVKDRDDGMPPIAEWMKSGK